MPDSINNTDDVRSKLVRSSEIDKAFIRCAEILKCHPNEIQKRLMKITSQLIQCKEILEALNE